MAITNFKTENQSFRRLMGNGVKYRVPMFQRDYSWTEQEWDDLWQDIIALEQPDGDDGHYMGYLVLQTADDREFSIIDGQQRITTIVLIVLGVLKLLKELADEGVDSENNLKRLDELRKSFIGYLDPVTLLSQSKLTLNRHNNQLFQSYLLPMLKAPTRNLKESEKLLRDGSEWFFYKIRERFVSVRSGAELAKFVDFLADRLFFTVITVSDELNSFRVFETLNSRGVRLSSTDLLKNYLFSVVHDAGAHESEISQLEERWESIVGKLASESIPDFLRVFWNSSHTLTRHSELFKAIRRTIKDRGDVFNLLREMERDADVYAALGDQNDSLWEREHREFIGEMLLFRVSQPYPLLLAAHRKLEASEFTRVLRACSIISFRYNVISNQTPAELERVYNSIAEKIAGGFLATAGDVIRAMGPVYLMDKQFKLAFEDKQIRSTGRNRKLVKYILFKIEAHLSGTAFDPSVDRYNIEHVLPANPGPDWDFFTDEQVDRCVYRIGNMTPMEASPNRLLGNSGFADKVGVYRQSQFLLTRQLADYTEWSPENIADRQKYLADQASAIWRLSEFD